MLNTAPAGTDLAEVCAALYKIAQKHVSMTAFADVNELLHISKILASHGIPLETAAKLRANVDDHIPAVARQSADYRLLRAQFRAALSTIADLGRKKSKTHKSDFHEGLQAGLRKAAKVAIIFLEDLNDSAAPILSNMAAGKTGNRIVR